MKEISNHAHIAGSWYPSETLFKNSEDHSSPFNLGVSPGSRNLLTGDFNFLFLSSRSKLANKIFELTRHFLTTDIESTFTARQDVSCSPPQISDITYNLILIGCVNSREKVFSEVQCIWYACVTFVYSIQHGNCGLGFQCTTLSIIESTEIKVGAAYRIFDRKSIQKFCRLLNFIVKIITEEDSSLCFYTFHML